MARRVLIVDDIRSNRLILKEILKGEYDVIEASGGEEALEIIDREYATISAVLLDISMPGTDGYEVLRQVRENPRLSQIPIIMITGNEGENTRVLSLAHGANDFVTKPYKSDIIRHCLKNHIAFHEAAETVSALQRDGLTRLYTRETFFEKVREMVREKEPGYYIMASYDIDKFKVINDQYGTDKGDAMLRHAAQVFREGFTPVGGICSRIAADEFAVLYPAWFTNDDLLKDIREKAAQAEWLVSPVTFSIGRYVVADKEMSPSAMYDRAMLAASSVKNQFDRKIAFYDETMRLRLLREQEIVSEMVPALNDRQFEAWFQPQYNHSTGAMIGAEALVRWRHPEKGIVPPNDFIPIFEQNGFIYELDKFVWEEVCASLRKWLDEGRNPLPVSVNLSRHDLLHQDAVSFITSLVKKYALPVSLLRLEVTESAFAKDSKVLITVVKELIALGYTVEIDDFGSGYSSLNTLKDVPAQILKLDMRFFDDCDDTIRGGNIIESVVRMAKWLDMSVIAEGVETKEQADYLCSIGCNYIQGYLYAKPMSLKQYEDHCRGAGKEERLLALETVENLNNNSFWNPASMDTLIFNSYVGAACIFEYSGGRFEIIRATDDFAKLFTENTTVDDVLKFDWLKQLDPQSAALASEALTRSAGTLKPVTGEFVFDSLPNCPRETYLKATMRVIASAGQRRLVYCLCENITAQRQAERELLNSDEQLRFLNDMSHDLLTQEDADTGINYALTKLMDYFRGARAYIFEYNPQSETADNTYEVCAEGIKSEIGNLQGLPISMVAAWTRAFDKMGYIAISDVASLDDSRTDEREILNAQGISSLFAAPICRDGMRIGLVGVDDPHLALSQIGRLSALGDYLAVMLTRRDLNKRIAADNKTLSDMMGDMPGGFAQMRLMPDGSIKTMYVNDGLCRMRGMTRKQLLKAEGSDAMLNVHPDDVEMIQKSLLTALPVGDTRHVQYRLRCGDGNYSWFSVFWRTTQGDSGEINLNVYYADTTAQEKWDMSIRETMPFVLSAIMATSQDLSFVKDTDFKYIICSPAFAKMCGNKRPEDIVGKTDFELFDEETASSYRRDDEKLFAGGESLIDYTEAIPSTDGVSHYSVTSKYILRDTKGTIIGLYGTGRDVTDTRAAFDRLRLLTDNMPGGLASYAISKKGVRLTYASDGYCALMGFTREEYEKETAKGVTRRVAEEDLPVLNAQIDAMYETGTPVDCTFRDRRAGTDEYVWVNLKGVLAERSGDTAFVNTVLFDVTKAHIAEQKEREAVQRLRLIMDNASTGIRAMTVTPDGLKYLFTNDMFYEMLGYTSEQYAAEMSQPAGIIHPSDRPEALKSIKAAVNVGDTDRLEFRAIKRNGEVIWLRAAITVTRFEGVESPVQLCVYTDITQIKESEKRIHALNENANTLMNDTPGGFCRMSINKDTNPSIMFVNDGFARMLGMTQDEVMAACSSDLYKCIYTEDLPEFAGVARQACETGSAFSTKCRLVRADGTIIWVLAAGRFVTSDSGEMVLNSYFTEITNEITAQQRQNQLLDNMPCGAALYEYDGEQLTAVHINKRYWELVGRVPTDDAKIHVLDMVHPDDRKLIKMELDYAMRQNKDVSVNVHILMSDGVYKPFNIAAKIKSAQDGLCMMYAAFTPASNRETALNDMFSMALFNIIADSTDIAFIKDADGRYVSCSSFMAEIAGYKNAEELIGKTNTEIVSPEQAEMFIETDAQVINTGKPMLNKQISLSYINGLVRETTMSKYPLRDSMGNIVGIYGSGRDVTQEKHNYDQLSLINDSVPGGIATYAVKGSEISIAYCNDGFCRLFGDTLEGIRKRGNINLLDWVFPEDRPSLLKQIRALINDGTPMDCIYKVRTLDSEYKWLSIKAVSAKHLGDVTIFSTVFLDITERQLVNEQLRISEEEGALALRHSSGVICRFDIAGRTLNIAPDVAKVYSLPSTLEGVPETPIEQGHIAAESAEAYRNFFNSIISGERECAALFKQNYLGEWRWMEIKGTTVFSDDQKPVRAIISMFDVTDRLEKESIYRKWQHSLDGRPSKSFSLFVCNLNRNDSYERREGELIKTDLHNLGRSFNERTRAYARICVHPDDSEHYISFVDSDAMMAAYYRGKRTDTLEYRQISENGEYIWIRLSVELVESPNSTDVEAYLMYEDIDKAKKDELQTKALSETDPLTGILNRAAFAARVNEKLLCSAPGAEHALLMMDVDSFKQVNDVFGHGAGDQALKDVAQQLRSVMRRGDLVARLGGDEFVAFMEDVQSAEAVIAKARKLRDMCRKSFSMEVQISLSVGIAFAPRDGRDFDTLYKKADSALYYVKGSGKDNQAIYAEKMVSEHLIPEPDSYDADGRPLNEKRRRMLIVDDSEITHELLQKIFKEEFIVETAKDGGTALIRMRHYGSAISVVLLDLMMPGMDGYAVLEKLRANTESRIVPVIIVSGDETREACLKAIRLGATDFITKPIDTELLRLRVHSAVSRAENERLRAKNALLETQNRERVRYDTAIAGAGFAFMEYDPMAKAFEYYPSISLSLAGAYDERDLFKIFIDDGVADKETVDSIRTLITNGEGGGIFTLKDQKRIPHRFRVTVRPIPDAKNIGISFVALD